MRFKLSILLLLSLVIHAGAAVGTFSVGWWDSNYVITPRYLLKSNILAGTNMHFSVDSLGRLTINQAVASSGGGVTNLNLGENLAGDIASGTLNLTNTYPATNVVVALAAAAATNSLGTAARASTNETTAMATNLLGSAAYSLASAFQSSHSALDNFVANVANYPSNVVNGANINLVISGGTLFGTNTYPATNVVVNMATNALASAAYSASTAFIASSRSNDFQLATENGTNWSLLSTNAIFDAINSRTNEIVKSSTNLLGSAAYSASSDFAAAASTNFLRTNGSVWIPLFAMKFPTTNYPNIVQAYQGYEIAFAKTNTEGGAAALGGKFQLVMPSDLTSNSLSLYLLSTIGNTNGPNSSNVIWRATCSVFAPSATNDFRMWNNGTQLNGTNTWAASNTGTNQTLSLTIPLTGCTANGGDLLLLTLERVTTSDTYMGIVNLIGAGLTYIRR